MSGPFLINRLIWLSLSIIILVATYFGFSFSTKKAKVKNEKNIKEAKIPQDNKHIEITPKPANVTLFKTLWFLTKFETKSIIKNPAFVIIVVIGLINL